MSLRLPLIAVLLIALPGAASAAVVNLTCVFNQYASPDGLKPVENFAFKLTFDTVTYDAFIIGNAGMSPLTMHIGSRGMTFSEVLGTGAVQTTTFHVATGRAVHSRNSMTNVLIPSQYYGRCEQVGG